MPNVNEVATILIHKIKQCKNHSRRIHRVHICDVISCPFFFPLFSKLSQKAVINVTNLFFFPDEIHYIYIYMHNMQNPHLYTNQVDNLLRISWGEIYIYIYITLEYLTHSFIHWDDLRRLFDGNMNGRCCCYGRRFIAINFNYYRSRIVNLRMNTSECCWNGCLLIAYVLFSFLFSFAYCSLLYLLIERFHDLHSRLPSSGNWRGNSLQAHREFHSTSWGF